MSKLQGKVAVITAAYRDRVGDGKAVRQEERYVSLRAVARRNSTMP